MRRRLLLLLLLAGCQPLPHPFADARNEPGPPLAPPDSVGVVVAPVEDAPQQAGAALAAALRGSDVPASTDIGNHASFRLEARALIGGPENATVLEWTLLGPTGKPVGQGTVQQNDGKDVWPALAKAAAPRIAALIDAGAPPESANVPAAVAVRAVKGAPGDGGTALARAIGSALGHDGIAVGSGDARYALSCEVAVTPAKDGQQLVSVRWILALPAGKPLGVVSQQNTVPAGSLDRVWGDVAYAVAAAAAPGIAQLIEQAQE